MDYLISVMEIGYINAEIMAQQATISFCNHCRVIGLPPADCAALVLLGLGM